MLLCLERAGFIEPSALHGTKVNRPRQRYGTAAGGMVDAGHCLRQNHAVTDRYYSLRRLSPFQGMLQVVDIDSAMAYSSDGRHWQVRCRNHQGHFRTIGVWSEDTRGIIGRCRDAAALDDALRTRPPLPFPQDDPYELWLLDKERARPLALLSSRQHVTGLGIPHDLGWRAFPVTDTRFFAPSLVAVDAARPEGSRPLPHGNALERQVNAAARPLAAVQWFLRHADGSGTGLQGARLSDNLAGRRLDADDFPELLVAEEWDGAAERCLVQEYHDWNAAGLLALQRLSSQTRRRLETAACRQPELLTAVYPLIPVVLNAEAMKIALVAARLLEAVER
ncbi:MAG: hypothetical protein ACYDHM_07550 [Acidiferrobacterales bacterium]